MAQQERFNELYERHHRAVLGFCLRRTAAPDAYDAAAEVFSVAWRRIDDVPTGEVERAWLYGVARKALSRQWRSARRLRKLVNRIGSQPDRVSPDTALLVVQRAEYARVLEAVSRLSPNDQEVLRLAAWEGLPHAQISEVLNISVAAVDQRLHRAKKRLAVLYEGVAPKQPSVAEEGEAS
ncbi:MAG: RNA polymerase sigma factor [Acidimicrobiia bacterium]